MLTDQEFTHNRPNQILLNKLSRQTMLMEVAIPNSNLQNKHNLKIIKYRYWRRNNNQKITMIISTADAVLENIPGNLKNLGLSEYL